MKWNEQLRQERKSRGWAQGWVAKEIGTTTDTVNRWENGKTFPSPFYQQQLSQLFGKSLEELGLFSFFSEGKSSRDKESELASQEEHVHNNQDASKDAELLERWGPGRYTLHPAAIDETSVQKSKVPAAQQEPVSSPVSDTQAHEPNTETLGDHRSSDQPLWELHIQMRGLSTLRPFRRFSSRSLLILSTMLPTILIIVALLLAFNPLLPPASPPHNLYESIDDVVQGTGINQFNYVGNSWEHMTGSQNTTCGYTSISNTSTVSWDNTTNDYVTITFTGVQIDFYGIVNSSHGIGALSLDGSDETMIDFYTDLEADNRMLPVLLWISPKLSAGTHTLKLRVTGNKNPRSVNTYVAIDRVIITH